MKNKGLVLIAVVMVVMLLFAACAPQAEPSDSETPSSVESAEESTGETTEDGKTVKMGLSMSAMDLVVFHAFADYLEENVNSEGAARGYSVEWTLTNASGDVTKQANDVRDLLSKGCDVIFCQAVDSKTILQSISEVHEAGKIFIMYNRKADESATGDQIPDATYNMDSEFQAYGAMVEVFKIMQEDGVEPNQILDVHGDTGDENAINRERGFRKACDEYGWTDKIVQVIDTGNWEPEVALQNTAAALQAYPDCNCMYIASDALLPGVQTALENAGKWIPRGQEGHVYLGGTDNYPSGIAAVQAGYMDGDVDVPAWQCAEGAAKGAFDLLEGKDVPVEEQMMKGTVINSNNVDEVIEEASLWGVDYKDLE